MGERDYAQSLVWPFALTAAHRALADARILARPAGLIFRRFFPGAFAAAVCCRAANPSDLAVATLRRDFPLPRPRRAIFG